MLRKAGKGLSRSSESSEYQTRAAIETYFTELRRYSFSLALRHTGKPDLADEIAQDAMIILLKSNTPKQFIKGWLHKVTLNLIIRNIRDEIRNEKLVSELIREEQIAVQVLEHELPALESINQPSAIKYLAGKDLRQYQQMMQYKDLKQYAAATKNSYACAREQSVRIRHNFKASYLKAHGWDSTPQILTYEKYKAIRRFLGKLVDLCKANAISRQRETNHTEFLRKYGDVFDGVQNVFDWGITPVGDNRYRVYLFDNADGVNSIMISLEIFISKANRILIRTCKRHRLASMIPIREGKEPEIETGKMTLPQTIFNLS
ncbi:MAG: sigma factor [Candidatus Cloacimonadaceae bacterium]|nr:sigma factor [Candidatus Cloacimonadaceae bacterium]